MKRLYTVRLGFLSLLMIMMTYNGFSQLSITSSGTNYVITFDNTVDGVNYDSIAGTGFIPLPAAGQFDSDAWAVTGWSDGAMDFGGSKTSGDYARGKVSAPQTTGGMYAFRIASGNLALGIQPGGSDWAPGTLTLKMVNNTGYTVSSIAISYTIYVRNDQARANSFNFSHSSNNSTYTAVTDLNYTSPDAATGTTWITVPRSTTLTGLNIANGSNYYLRWSGADVTGSGSRDEFGLNDITINVTAEGVSNPSGFDAFPYSTTQNNMTWVLNTNNDSVMVAHNTTNTFGTPTGIYEVGGAISGGGTVLYKGTGLTTNQSGLTPNTKYYYRIWSKSAAGSYSVGVTDSSTTFKVEPSDYPTDFSASGVGISMVAAWSDATGSQAPDGYLVILSTQNNITAPVDGTPVADDIDISDGTCALNVAQGIGSATFYKLNESTTYYSKIFSYTNSGTAINYKTDGETPSGYGITVQSISINTFESGYGTWQTVNVASDSIWRIQTGTAAYGTANYASMNGYLCTVGSNDWLISPGMNFDSYSDRMLLFFISYNHGTITDELTLKYSTDYISGDPTLATWTDITFTKPTVALTWIPSGFIDLSAVTGSNVHIAFQYLSSTTSSTTRNWRVDEIEITGQGVSDPTNFNATAVSSNQVELTWTKNNNNNDVMVARTITGTFGVPQGDIQPGQEIDGGGLVIYKGPGENYSDMELSGATTYYYKLWSIADGNNYSSGVTDNATTQYAEPTNHPTSFQAEVNSFDQLTLSWTDSDAGHYLIKGSSVGYESIVPPTDMTGESDGFLVKNVDASVQTALISGLSANTQYYFKIFPYNGSVTSSNYKIDGEVPQTSATTGQFHIDLVITEVTDPYDDVNARYVEIMNIGTLTYNFTNTVIYLSRQANGGSTSWADARLTGSLAPGETYIVGYNASYFSSAYGISADMVNGAITGNGNDGYFLYYGANHSTGTLVDAFGVINEDGLGKDWDYTDKKAVRKRTVTASNQTWTASEWVILTGNQNVQDMTPDYHAGTITWQGTTSTEWNAKGDNWDSPHGYVPDASCIVNIPVVTNQPAISASSACHELNMDSGATLSISGTTGSLHIVGQ
jgi:hypothetical protein